MTQLNLFASGRQCVYAFLGLPYHERIRIALDLGLLGGEREVALFKSEDQLWKKIFSRVRERNMVEELWKSTQEQKLNA